MEWSVWVGRSPSAGDEPPRLIALPTPAVDKQVLRAQVLKCTTWGEVRALGEPIFDEVVEYAEEASEHESSSFDGDEPFEPQEVLPVEDGDWPGSLYALMDDNLPPRVIAQWGASERTGISGMFSWLDASHRDESSRSSARTARPFTRMTPSLIFLSTRPGSQPAGRLPDIWGEASRTLHWRGLKRRRGSDSSR